MFAPEGMRRRRYLLLSLLVLLLGIVVDRHPSQAGCQAFADLIVQGAYGVVDTNGQLLDTCHPDQALVPASVLKLATIAAALDLLGPTFRFRTEFYTDSQDNLYIKGFGDPSLVSEEIVALVAQLRHKDLARVQHLYIDTSAFALTQQVPGQEDSDNPYDAPVGPVSVNFNAVAISKTAASKGVSGRIISGESQTPTLPIMAEIAHAYPAGTFRINICAKGCDAETRMARYAGELFAALLRQGGISVLDLGGIRSVPTNGARLVHIHQSSQTLLEMSRSTLRYSSNFMANLIFLACGAKQFGHPATWQKAEQAVHQALARQLGEASAAAIVQVEGSGLSRANRVTVRAILVLLARFRSQIALLNQEAGLALKTGTMTGVYNLAGYLPHGQAFVILLNQEANTRAAVLVRLQGLFASRSLRGK